MALKFLNDGYFAGKVGIGTASPQVQLTLLTTMSTSPTTQIYLDVDGSNIVGGGSEIIFNSSASGGTPTSYNAKIKGTRSSAGDGSSDLSFFTTLVSSATTPAVRMTIKDSGNVGIGTSAPSRKLVVSGAANGIIQSNDTAGAGSFLRILADVTAENLINWDKDTDLRFCTSDEGFGNFSERMRIDSSGNVGIGKTPDASNILDIKRDDTSGVFVTHRNDFGFFLNRTYADYGNDGNTVEYQERIGVDGNNSSIGNFSNHTLNIKTNNQDRITVLNTGNVGIGTTNPVNRLQVTGASVGIDSEYMIRDNRNNTIFQQSASTLATNRTLTIANATYSKIVIPNGNVGIGTTSPTEKLHVAGNARVTGAYYDSNNSPGTANQVLVSTVTGTDWIDGSAIPGVPAGSGAAGQVTVWSSNDVITGYTRFKVYDAGGQIQITDGTRDIRINSGYAGSTAMIGTSSSHDLGFMTGNSQRVTIDNSGNVGIGTTAPSDGKLQVYSNSSSDWVGYFYNQNTNGIGLHVETNAHGTEQLLRLSSLNGAGGSNTVKMVVRADGNVGIGTNSPTGKLHVEGQIRLFKNGDDVLANSGIYIANAANNRAYNFQQNADGSSLNLWAYGGSSWANRLTVQAAGNVGIGKTNPGQKLDVSGSIASNSIYLYDSTSNDRLVLDLDASDNLQIATGTSTGSRGITFFTENSEKMRILSGGNVGIGTTGPGSKLEVAAANSQIRLTDTDDSKFVLYSYSGGKLIVRNNSVNTTVNQYTLTEDGRFGIGTISPTAGLHVVGTGLFTGLVSGITPVNAANFVTKAYVDGSGGGTGPFLPLAGGTMTGTNGVLMPDNFRLKIGTSEDLLIFHDGTDSQIFNQAGDLKIRNDQNDGDIIFMSDNGSGGTTEYFRLDGSFEKTVFSKDIFLNDSVKALFGNSSDLQIYHNGSNSFIDNGTGNLTIDSGVHLLLKTATGESLANFFANGANELFYDNSKKLSTGSTGIAVTGNVVIDSALLSNQENTDIDSAAAEMVAQVAIATYTAAFFDFVVKKSTNVRSGTVYACHDGTNVEFTETSTQDLGDTSDVVLSVDISGGNMRLMATVASDDWSVKSLIRAI